MGASPKDGSIKARRKTYTILIRQISLAGFIEYFSTASATRLSTSKVNLLESGCSCGCIYRKRIKSTSSSSGTRTTSGSVDVMVEEVARGEAGTGNPVLKWRRVVVCVPNFCSSDDSRMRSTLRSHWAMAGGYL
jgi:hypothetical protein